MALQLLQFLYRTRTLSQPRYAQLRASKASRIKQPNRIARVLAIRCLAGLLAAIGIARAQDPIPIDPRESAPIHGQRTVRPRPVSNALGLPIWQYDVVSPVNGVSYSGYIVGTGLRGATSTTIPVNLVPFIVQFNNTTTGFTTTFDPSTQPDAGCTAGRTAMNLIENSPIFESRPWILNGVDCRHDAVHRRVSTF